MIAAVFPPEPVVSANLSKNIADELVKNGYNVTVLSPLPTRPHGFDFKNSCDNSNHGFEHIVIRSITSSGSELIGRIKENISFGIATSRYVTKYHHEISAIYADTWPLFAQFFLVRVAARYKIPIILHVQDVYPDSFVYKLPKFFAGIVYHCLLPIDKYILKYSTRIIGISPQMIDYLSASRNINKNKFVLIRNWHNDEMFTNQFIKQKNNKKYFRFIFVGSVSPTASVETLIHGFHIANIKDSELIIAGSGSAKDQCIALAKSLNNPNIHFVNIQPNQVFDIQCDADVLLLPLKKGIAQTATPSKLTAYMFSKKPIIACVETNTDVANIIKEAKCGLVIPPEESNQLSDAMCLFANYKQSELDTMGDCALGYAKAHLSKNRNLLLLTNEIIKLLEPNCNKLCFINM